MTSTSTKRSGRSNPNPADRAQAATGHFMLTLCELAAPVSIRPPQSPRLKPFTFFMSRARQPDGSERFYLHMGYFETLSDAERCREAVRRRYPDAFATMTTGGSLQPAEHQGSEPLPRKDESLTDTQVLRILETRGDTSVPDDVEASKCDQIALLRPDDTGTRRALREAVAQGAPVSFAVQLQWSTQPIDLGGVPSLAIFKPHTLYATESRREGRSCYFLRLGFFADPISAKRVAAQVCSTFASAAVVPVVEQEITRARKAGVGSSAIPYLGEPGIDGAMDFNRTSGSSAHSTPLREAPRRLFGGAPAVAQTPEASAKRGAWTVADSLSESGVRHLRVEVQEHLSGRWKIVRFGAKSSNMAHSDS
jgi:hypothetical protein